MKRWNVSGLAVCAASVLFGCNTGTTTTMNPNLPSDGGSPADTGAPVDTGTVVTDTGPADVQSQPPPDVQMPPSSTFTDVYGMVISAHCGPCHTSGGGIGISQAHLDMTSQAAAFSNLVNVPAAGVSCGGMGTRVVPGNPDGSILYLKVNPSSPSPCGSKMPLGGPPLSQAQADMIRSWIAAGAMNN